MAGRVPTSEIEPSDITAVLDTNVLLDVYSCHDLERIYQDGAHVNDPRAIARRARAREALILGMYLSDIGATTYSVATEPIEQMHRHVDQNNGAEFTYHYTMLFTNVVRSELLRGWKDALPPGHDPTMAGNRADDALVDFAAAHNLPLVSSEGLSHTGDIDEKKRVRKRAKGLGVPVFTPREFYEGKADEGRLIPAFLKGFEARAPVFAARHDTAAIILGSIQWMNGYFHHVLFGVTEGHALPVAVSVVRKPSPR